MKPQYIRYAMRTNSLQQCQQECNARRDFTCRGFNYIDDDYLQRPNRYPDYKNCELSDRDTRELDVQNNNLFEYGNHNFYERNHFRTMADSEADCLDGELFDTIIS